MQNRTVYKLLGIFAVPTVVASVFSLVIGISLITACGLLVVVLKSLTFQITVEDDGVYKDIVQLPIGIGRGKLVDCAEIESVEAKPTENLMTEYVRPSYRDAVPFLSLYGSSGSILTDDNRYFGADIEGTIYIKKVDGTEVRLSSRDTTEMASAVRQCKRSSTTIQSFE